MSRTLRLESLGAIYHVTSRGDRREPICRDDDDRIARLNVLTKVFELARLQARRKAELGDSGVS